MQDLRITKVWAKNFRSIADASVELNPLTVLVGPNASGKSNILDVLRFIKDSLRFDLETAISLRHGIDRISRWQWDNGGSQHNIEVGFEADLYPFSLQYYLVITNDDGTYHIKDEFSMLDI